MTDYIIGMPYFHTTITITLLSNVVNSDPSIHMESLVEINYPHDLLDFHTTITIT